jgi:hypothetical protein
MIAKARGKTGTKQVFSAGKNSGKTEEDRGILKNKNPGSLGRLTRVASRARSQRHLLTL